MGVRLEFAIISLVVAVFGATTTAQKIKAIVDQHAHIDRPLCIQ
jgi:hypothetical protein